MKPGEYPIEIPLSKQKLVLLLISAIAFVAIGIWFVSKPESFRNGILGNPTIVLSIGILSIVVFGLAAFVMAKKLKDNAPGLIIDKTGITDNSTGVPAGHIPWSDIKEIKTNKVFNQKFLVIMVNKPETYINRQGNDAAKKGVQANYKISGSPVNIPASTLKYNFDELESLVKAEFKKHKTA
ncbi:STM3941 family protein [Emticicia sp. BO119]|uniref:STM3941 family protein n=1 Tax=Emticicia sp. BO119 TaxID=2757768 RepID=UPI0015F0F13F|nr:STM3941 family protein [Emticicia sp. BO119]MBA4853009.1 hypothetical protein [Emticicia sp. BO119]